MITLYSTKCPRCNILEKKLKDKGIEFAEVNDSELMINKGFVSAPMLDVDGEVMDYVKAVAWVNEN